MRLYFLRHGRADRSAWDGPDDLRPLTSEGKARVQRAADCMAKMNLGVEAIFSSPLTRAWQTAEITATGLGLEHALYEEDQLGPGFGRDGLRVILRSHPGITRCMLVGHEPDFSITLEDIIGGGSVVFKKGALARVDMENLNHMLGDLVWLIPSKAMIL